MIERSIDAVGGGVGRNFGYHFPIRMDGNDYIDFVCSGMSACPSAHCDHSGRYREVAATAVPAARRAGTVRAAAPKATALEVGGLGVTEKRWCHIFIQRPA